MCLRNNLETYGVVAKFFHWVMAILIIGLLAVGLIMSDMENSPDRFKLIGLHKEFGLVVLALAIMRLGWKILDISPLLPAHMSKMAKFMAHAGHFSLYGLMFAMPLSGWLMSSASGFPVSIFGMFVVPNIIAPDKEFGHLMNQVHEVLAWLLIAIIIVHVLAALFHHFYYHDNVLKRMLPTLKRKK